MNIQRIILKQWFILLAVLFVFCSEAFCFPIKVKDDLDREIEFLKVPERIVSLAPTHTEILYALGLGDNIIGVTDYCNYPPEVRLKQKVGGFAKPDIDKILALKPDLILAFGTIQKPVVKELKQRGQRVFWIYPHTVEGILDSIETIGEITGRDYAANQVKEKLKKKIKYIRGKLGNLPDSTRPTIFRVMGLNPPGTIGNDSFQTDVFYLAGGKNVFADVKKDFFQIDNETLLRRNPDVIIICGKNIEETREKIKNQKGWRNLTAVKKNRIFVISCDLICRPGPRVIETIEKIARYLHPDRFSVYPQRIISLGPAITEELYLLGVENRIVGVSTYCHRPQDARDREKVGTVIKADLEKIMSLKPDLVVATSLMDAEQVEKLQNLGLKVIRFPPVKNFDQICEQFLELGRLVGGEKEAEEIIQQVKLKVDVIEKKVENLPEKRVFVQIGAKPLFTVTKDSFINDFIKLAGGTNIVQDSTTGLYSREKVLEENPDCIIIVTMGIVGEEERKTWQKFKTLNAVKNNRIYIIDSYKLCSPTPVSFVEVLEEIIQILHPESKTSKRR